MNFMAMLIMFFRIIMMIMVIITLCLLSSHRYRQAGKHKLKFLRNPEV